MFIDQLKWPKWLCHMRYTFLLSLVKVQAAGEFSTVLCWTRPHRMNLPLQLNVVKVYRLEDHQFKTFCPLSWHSRGYLAPRSQLLFSISLCIQKTICLGTHKWKSFVWTSFKTTVLELQYLTLGLIWWENISSSLIMRNREFDGNQIAARCNGWIGSLEFGLSGFRSCSSV